MSQMEIFQMAQRAFLMAFAWRFAKLSLMQFLPTTNFIPYFSS
jgi:hypothetical protein